MLGGKHGGCMRGLFRDGDWAQVTDEHHAILIPRDRYEAQGYQPPFDDLPMKDEYEADNA